MGSTLSRIYYSLDRLVSPVSYKALREMLKVERMSRKGIEAVQVEKLRRLLLHSYQSVPYYKEVMDERGVRPEHFEDLSVLKRLPILTKEIVREDLDRLVSNRFPKGELILSGTGGSTGIPMRFYYDRRFLRIVKALKLRNLSWVGWKPGDNRLKLWGSDFDMAIAKDMRTRVGNWLRNVILIGTFNYRKETLERAITAIRRFNPDFLEGYTMILASLAGFANENGMDLSTCGVKKIIASAEVLTDEVRGLLSRTFGAPVFDRYGGRELSDIAQECSEGRMHINDDLVIVEIVDEDGNPVENCAPGNLILTGLESYAMPLIRYRVDDVGSLSQDSCHCGRALGLLGKIAGRTQDLIRLRDGGVISPIAVAHLLKDYPIIRYRGIQEDLDHFRLEIVPADSPDAGWVSDIESKLKTAIPQLEIEVRCVNEIDPGPSGKWRSVVSNVKGGGSFEAPSIEQGEPL